GSSALLQRVDDDHPSLEGGGFSDAVIEAFDLGYCNRGLMKGRIAIPLHDESGMLIGYAGRIVDDNAINENTPRYLYPGSRERNGTRYEFHKSEFLYNADFRRPLTLLITQSLQVMKIDSFSIL